MTDLVLGDPAALINFSSDSPGRAADAIADATNYVTSWTTFSTAPGAPVAPDSMGGVLADLLQDLDELDQEPGRFGQALLDLDQDHDGRLTTADGVSELGLLLVVRNAVLDPTVPITAETANALAGSAEALITVERDAGDGTTRVVRINAEELSQLQGLSPAEAQAILEHYGLTGEEGPLQFVIHGFRTTTESAVNAGGAAADLYDANGAQGATVVVVDWKEGSIWTGFGSAYEDARETGNSMAVLFTAIAASNPDADLSIFAHSLGNNVGLLALTDMVDPIDHLTGLPIRFQVDYTGIEPAIPWDAAQPGGHHGGWNEYGALTSDRIGNLILTVNKSDDALFLYEINQKHGALGHESIDSPTLAAIVNDRTTILGGTTTILNQDSQVGGWGSEGHLTIDPYGEPIVAWLAMYQQQTVRDGTPPQGTAVAESLVRALFPGDVGERVLADSRMQNYLNYRAEDEADPDLAYVAELARQIEDGF